MLQLAQSRLAQTMGSRVRSQRCVSTACGPRDELGAPAAAAAGAADVAWLFGLGDAPPPKLRLLLLPPPEPPLRVLPGPAVLRDLDRGDIDARPRPPGVARSRDAAGAAVLIFFWWGCCE